MKLCIFDDGRIGVVRDETVYDVTPIVNRLPASRYGDRQGDALIGALPSLRSVIEQLAANAKGIPVRDVALKPPVGHPGKLLAAPGNYQDHLDEARAEPETFAVAQVRRIHEMGFFLKAPSSLAGCSDGITLSRVDRRTDHEIELALIIGRRCRGVTRQAALDFITGYCIGLDITLRGPEERSLRKSIDTYSVLGPYLVTSDELGDPSSLSLCLDVNGEARQRANTRDLIVDVPGLIEFASAWYTLEPGDVIFTGTPAGVGPIRPGDLISASIERVGSMEVRVHDLQ
jgi:2,4-diketo-3-deoxy-L-fuconate hydrolase